eukprot:9604-Heterococcus_DN1.PRE.4
MAHSTPYKVAEISTIQHACPVCGIIRAKVFQSSIRHLKVLRRAVAALGLPVATTTTQRARSMCDGCTALILPSTQVRIISDHYGCRIPQIFVLSALAVQALANVAVAPQRPVCEFEGLFECNKHRNAHNSLFQVNTFQCVTMN